MSNPTTTFYIYKCRLCNKKFSNTESGCGAEHENLINAIHRIYVENQPPVSMTDIHKCKDNQYGISDLIGCKSE